MVATYAVAACRLLLNIRGTAWGARAPEDVEDVELPADPASRRWVMGEEEARRERGWSGGWRWERERVGMKVDEEEGMKEDVGERGMVRIEEVGEPPPRASASAPQSTSSLRTASFRRPSLVRSPSALASRVRLDGEERRWSIDIELQSREGRGGER